MANVSIAWWIAFGPHGPRALDPPGEWTRVWLYTALGVGISVALFLTIHAFARPPPRTMTKEWQEATNEYLKVSTPMFRSWTGSRLSGRSYFVEASTHTFTRSLRRAILSMVSAAKDIAAKAMFRASRPRHKVSSSTQRSRGGTKSHLFAPGMESSCLCTVTSIMRTAGSPCL